MFVAFDLCSVTSGYSTTKVYHEHIRENEGKRKEHFEDNKMSFLWFECSHMYTFLSSTNGRLVSKNKNKKLTKENKNQNAEHVPTD